MTTDTDLGAETCNHDWCLAHRACDCAYSRVQPHTAAGCRYRQRDGDQEDDDR